MADQLADLQTQVRAHEQAIQELVAAVTTLSEGTDAKLAERDRSHTEVVSTLQDVVAQVQVLDDRLHAYPQLDDSRFVLREAGGQEQLCFEPASDAAESTYVGFEDMFRGTEADVAARQQVYVDLLAGTDGPLLDVGCGRGEFLEALATRKPDVLGVDLDPGMVARCTAKGLDVEQGDGIAALEARAPESLGAVFAAQVIEHLSVELLERLLRAAHRALGPGGLVVLETVNPHSLLAFKAFWLDLTHEQPIYPEVALTYVSAAGFEGARVFFPGATGSYHDNRRTQGDYAVLAYKPKS